MHPSESENIRKKRTWKMEREQEKRDRDRDNGVGCIASYVASFLCKCLSFDSPVVLISLRLISSAMAASPRQEDHGMVCSIWCAGSRMAVRRSCNVKGKGKDENRDTCIEEWIQATA